MPSGSCLKRLDWARDIMREPWLASQVPPYSLHSALLLTMVHMGSGQSSALYREWGGIWNTDPVSESCVVLVTIRRASSRTRALRLSCERPIIWSLTRMLMSDGESKRPLRMLFSKALQNILKWNRKQKWVFYWTTPVVSVHLNTTWGIMTWGKVKHVLTTTTAVDVILLPATHVTLTQKMHCHLWNFYYMALVVV
jgi:hypothetical protein